VPAYFIRKKKANVPHIGGFLFGRHTCTSSYMLCPNTKLLTVSNIGEISRILLDLLLKPPAANLLKPLPIQRPEVEVRIAKGVLTPVTIWSFAHAQQHAQSLY